MVKSHRARTIEKAKTKEIVRYETERAIKTLVKDRSEAQHHLLIKHYGGCRKYLLSMGKFKDCDIQGDKT